MKILATILSLIIVFSLIGCQPTPIETPVIGPNSVTSSSNASVAFEKLEVPSHITETNDQFPKLKIYYDADVVVPETNAYPVTEVQKKILTKDTINSYITDFSGENSTLYSQWNLTQDEWMQKLTEAKKYENAERVTEHYIDYLQKQVENSPATVENPITNISELLALPADKQPEAYIRSQTNRILRFDFDQSGGRFIYCRDMFLEVYPASRFADDQYNTMDGSVENFKWHQPGTPEISQEEALNEATECMKKMGADLNLYFAEPCSVLTNEVNKNTGWIFTFTRKISDLQAQWHDMVIYVNPESLPSFGAPWEPEFLKIAIDKDGICMLWWQGASEIKSTIAGSVQLEKFDDIKQRITNQLNYIYGTNEDAGGNGLDINITKIELGISLISVKDKPDIGEYIPTWYVSFKNKFRKDNTWVNPSQIMFSAVDGSYIEPRLTNADLMVKK